MISFGIKIEMEHFHGSNIHHKILHLIYFKGKHNIPVPFIWFKQQLQFLSCTTPKSVLDMIIQYKMCTPVYTSVHRKKLNQAFDVGCFSGYIFDCQSDVGTFITDFPPHQWN